MLLAHDPLQQRFAPEQCLHDEGPGGEPDGPEPECYA